MGETFGQENPLGRHLDGQYRHTESYPWHAALEARHGRRDRLARPEARPSGGKEARHPESLRLLRGDARGPGDRRDLQSAAEQPSHRLDDRSAQGRQACALREAVRHERQGRGARPEARQGQARDGSLHDPLPSAMAEGARADPLRQDRRLEGGAGLLLLQQRRPEEHPQHPGNGRRRDLRYRRLRHPLRALHVRGGAEAHRLADRLGPDLQDRPAHLGARRFRRGAAAHLHHLDAACARISA